MVDTNIRDKKSVFSVFSKQDNEGNNSLIVSVKGVHCASCIQIIENALNEQKDVISARVNMTTQYIRILWKGKKDRGNALISIVEELGYEILPFNNVSEKTGITDQERFLLRCIAISGFAMGNLMMMSISLWSSDSESMGIFTQGFFQIISCLIALPAIIYAGRPFFYSAWKVIKKKHANMDVPISLAIILTSFISLFETINNGEHIYFDSSVMLLFFLLIGRFLDVRAKEKAKKTANQLLSVLHGTATILKDDRQFTIPIHDIEKDMLILVSPGESIPADGIIINGISELDMSLITGETLPKIVKEGDDVFAGTINITASIKLRVSKASNENLVSEIVRFMEKAEQGQAKYVCLADKASKLYIPIVHGISLLTFFFWWLWIGELWQISLLNAITVLIITCPCALGLAVPVVQVLASSKLMKKGVLLKSGKALEKLASINFAIFDKTGTLTTGKQKLLRGDFSKHDLKFAASLAVHSKHPLSQAICKVYDGKLFITRNLKEFTGKGLEATIGKKVVRLGNERWCGIKNFEEDDPTKNILWLSVEKESPKYFIFSDQLRNNAKEVITNFHKAGIRTILLSGDSYEAVLCMANAVGIKDFHASLSPSKKCEIVKNLKKKGNRVLMIGDGLNDAPALTLSDVSISPSTAMDISQNSSDIIFQSNNFFSIITILKTAKKSNRLVKQNFALTVLYNLLAIPFAVMGYVTPLIAAIAMSGSSLMVIGNSFRLNIEDCLE